MRAKLLLVALLLWPGLAFGASSISAAGNFGQASAEVTAAPITMCAWFKTTNTTSEGNIAFYFDNGVGANFYLLTTRGDVAGDPVDWIVTSGGASVSARTSSGLSSGTWHHTCGVEIASNSRAVYIDGGSKGTGTDSKTATVDAFRIHGGSAGMVGQVAEVSIWNVALTDAEVASLAKGFAPPCVRRASLVSYYPLVRHDGATLLDTFGAAANATVTGTVTTADHPRIINCQ